VTRIAGAAGDQPSVAERSVARMKIVDVWMQHPTRRFLDQPFFESLRRWAGQDSIPEVPLSVTIETMDRAGVDVGLIAAWWGPHGALIDNDEVASFVREHPSRLFGVASVDLTRPMQAVRELRRCVRELGFRGLGTNYPMLTASACLEGLDSLGLSEEAGRLYLTENARRVFKLEATD